MLRTRLCLPTLLLLSGLWACASCQQPTRPTGTAAPAKRGSVIFDPAGAKPVRVHVEIMRTPAERSRGLMYRKHLGARDGMLFIFDNEQVHPFWMKNTYLPLDMIFIDNANKVVGVVQNARPRTTDQRSVNAASRFVVEVNAGFAGQHGIEVGTRVQLP